MNVTVNITVEAEEEVFIPTTLDQPYAYSLSAVSPLFLLGAVVFCLVIFATLLIFWLTRGHWKRSSNQSASQGPAYRQIPEVEMQSHNREVDPVLRDRILGSTFNTQGTDDEELCSFCLDKLAGEEELCTIPTCGHTFHAKCLHKLMAQQDKCPNCRCEISIVE